MAQPPALAAGLRAGRLQSGLVWRRFLARGGSVEGKAAGTASSQLSRPGQPLPEPVPGRFIWLLDKRRARRRTTHLGTHPLTNKARLVSAARLPPAPPKSPPVTTPLLTSGRGRGTAPHSSRISRRRGGRLQALAGRYATRCCAVAAMRCGCVCGRGYRSPSHEIATHPGTSVGCPAPTTTTAQSRRLHGRMLARNPTRNPTPPPSPGRYALRALALSSIRSSPRPTPAPMPSSRASAATQPSSAKGRPLTTCKAPLQIGRALASASSRYSCAPACAGQSTACPLWVPCMSSRTAALDAPPWPPLLSRRQSQRPALESKNLSLFGLRAFSSALLGPRRPAPEQIKNCWDCDCTAPESPFGAPQYFPGPLIGAGWASGLRPIPPLNWEVLISFRGSRRGCRWSAEESSQQRRMPLRV
ncbi:hypothetical protein BDV95DRAFT_657729 [Massariosphaeria phaeospora]|uniref:Uncharacterized protein n=1 Tax=Massariosphaeria phaeospora TaxID=100035 RepID=A0A7C8M0W7_9PLEO|nr:hypothetical protein BDV95DRAFT_657729 [Massariosphaeria phaeospora]